MNKKYFMATIMFGAVMFAAGFLIRPLVWPGEKQQDTAAEPEIVVEVQQQELTEQELAARGYLSMETLRVRIDDGVIQWYDGTVWHTAATVEEMEKEDKFYAAQESFREFEEQMKQQLEAEREAQESNGGQGETLLVGRKAEPKPAEKPKTTQPVVTAPVTVPVVAPEPAAPLENTGSGGNAGGGNSGNAGSGGNTGGDSGNAGSGGNTGGDSGNAGSGGDTGGDSGNTGDSGSSGSDSGDGENMEWSDDYL